MFRYEILMLATPEITQDEGKNLETHLDKVMQAGSATMISFERWGKYRLAYPVKNKDYGVYYLARFEAEKVGSLIEEVKTLFKVKLYTVVMRSIVTKLDTSGSLSYQRPPSLEEAPARDVSSFLSDSLSGSRRRGRSRGDWGPKPEQRVEAKETSSGASAATESTAKEAVEKKDASLKESAPVEVKENKEVKDAGSVVEKATQKNDTAITDKAAEASND